METTSSPQIEKFEAWGRLELFGHKQLAGRISEQTVGGVHFVRIDVPKIDDEHPAYTQMFTQGAIYSLTITTEYTALLLAKALRAAPITAYDVEPAQRALAFSQANRTGHSDPNDDPDY